MRILAWPFVMAWGLIALIISAVGRIFALGTGLALTGLGALLCVTVVGIVIGAPLAAFGVALIGRSIF